MRAIGLMAVYSGDREDWFRECLRSILGQTRSFEKFVLIVDGSVPTELVEVIEYFDENESVDVIWLRENAGLARALNVGLDHLAENDFLRKDDVLFRVDADDILRADRVERQLQEFNEEQLILGSAMQEVDENGTVLGTVKLPRGTKALKRRFYFTTPVFHPTVAYSGDLFADGIRYPLQYSRCEDLALWALFLQRGVEFRNIDEPLVCFRFVEHSLRRRSASKALHDLQIRIWHGPFRGPLHLAFIPLACLAALARVLPFRVRQLLYNLRRS